VDNGKLYVTSGDIAGIGPEVVAKAITALDDDERSKLQVVDPGHCVKQLIGPSCSVDLVGLGDVMAYPGQDNKVAAQLAWEGLKFVADAVSAEQSGAVATGPVHKGRLHEIGFPFPGQTEFFADAWGGMPIMMLSDGHLHVVPATIHVALKQVPHMLNIDHLTQLFLGTADAARKHLGILSPRLAVCGLNPHAGEAGLFGFEESEIIMPAISKAMALDGKVMIFGPLAADSLFLPHIRTNYDVIIGMYHDQVLGPFKAISFADGVNATIGLPHLRVAPDHGTADDIAGKNMAHPGPMLAAIRMGLKSLS